MLLGLIHLSVAHKGVEKRFALVVLCEEIFARNTETVEATAQRKTFYRLAVDSAEAYTLHKVEDVLVKTVFLALGNDGYGGRVAHAFNGCETETYLSFLVHTKLLIALVHIGTQCCNAHGLTFIHQFGDFCNLIATSAHDGCHKLGRVVGFHIGCLECHP